MLVDSVNRRNIGFAEVEIRSSLRPIRQSLQGVLRLGVVEPRSLDAVVDDGVVQGHHRGSVTMSGFLDAWFPGHSKSNERKHALASPALLALPRSEACVPPASVAWLVFADTIQPWRSVSVAPRLAHNLTVGMCPAAFATIAIHLRHGDKRSIQAQWLEVLPEKRLRAEIAAL